MKSSQCPMIKRRGWQWGGWPRSLAGWLAMGALIWSGAAGAMTEDEFAAVKGSAFGEYQKAFGLPKGMARNVVIWKVVILRHPIQ